MSKRAVLYARVSGDDANNSTSSLNGQLDMCRARAAERGYIVVAELAENEVSGARLDAPELGRALDMARAGQLDVLVARELDRLSRSLAKQLLVEEELRRSGVTVEYVLGEYPDTPEGNLNKNIKAVVAEYERLKIAERMTRGRMEVVKAGGVLVHGNAPFGYDCVRSEDGRHNTLVINESQAEIIRLIYSLYLDERLTARGIALRLNEMGIPSPKKKQWYPAVVRTMLSSETYAGTWHYGKRTGEGAANPVERHIAVSVPAVVSSETWEAARRQREANRTNAFRNQKYDYLLARRVTCAVCGGSMGITGVRPSGKFAYYGCTAARSSWVTNSCDMHRNFRTDYVDAAAWEWVAGLLFSPEALTAGYKTYLEAADEHLVPLRRQAEMTGAQLAQEEEKLARLLDLYLAGDFDRAMLHERRKRLESSIRSLRAQREQLGRQATAAELERTELASLVEWVGELGTALQVVSESAEFATRRDIVERLDVRASLAFEDGVRVMYLTCRIGRGGVIKNFSSHSNNRNNYALTTRIEVHRAIAAEFGALLVAREDAL